MIVKLTRQKTFKFGDIFPIDKFEKILYTIYRKTSCEASERSETRKKRGCYNVKRANNRRRI